MFKVTNHNEFLFSAMFGGRVFKFPPGRTVACEDDAAAHIFGIGDPDKTTILARHGWATPMESTARGLDILAKFKFEHIAPKLDVPHATDDHGAAPVVREPEAKGRSTDGPMSVASGTQGQPGLRPQQQRPAA